MGVTKATKMNCKLPVWKDKREVIQNGWSKVITLRRTGMLGRHQPQNTVAKKSFQVEGAALPKALSREETSVLRNSTSECVAGAGGEVQNGLGSGQATVSMGFLQSIPS